MVDKINYGTADLAERDYARARRQAFWRKVRSMLGRKCNDLIAAGELFEALPKFESRHIGLQEVTIDKIVGSSGRFRDFDLAFLPLRQDSDGRWLNIARANRAGVNLPLPLLYQIGDAYIVEDGNHRVSVASASGQETVRANVVVIDSPAIVAEPSCTRLGFKIPDEKAPAGAACSHCS